MDMNEPHIVWLVEEVALLFEHSKTCIEGRTLIMYWNISERCLSNPSVTQTVCVNLTLLASGGCGH